MPANINNKHAVETSKKILFNNFKKLNLANWIVVIGAFSVSLAKYVVIPFIAIYLVTRMHFTVSAAGIVVAARLWGQRGLTILGGPITDWLGQKTSMVVGLLIMCLAYLLLAYSYSFFPITFWILISGLGGSIYTVATKSFLTQEITYQERVFILSLRTTALSLGCAIGPFLGMIIFTINPKLIFLVTSFVLLALAIANQVILSTIIKKNNFEKKNSTQIYMLFTNKIFLKISLLTILFYIFYIQIELTYPLFAHLKFSTSSVSMIFLLNAIVVASSQVLLSNFIAKNSLKHIFMLGMAFISIGLLIAYFSQDTKLIFYLSVIIFSYGEILILPKLDTELVSNISPKLIGSAFGFAGLASAIGAELGSMFGGKFFNALGENYWLVLGCFAVLLIMTTLLLTSFKGKNYAITK